jgi:hypothetical protein
VKRPSLLMQLFSCWHWKCALMSATARSLVYLVALARSGPHGRASILAVEMIYVTLTAGVYAGMQQRALRLRSRLLGNVIVAVGVPALAQAVDFLVHRSAGAPVPIRAVLAVSIFAGVSALFHLFVMRRGVFLTGEGRSLADDFKRIPRLIGGFVIAPYTLMTGLAGRTARAAESEAAL